MSKVVLFLAVVLASVAGVRAEHAYLFDIRGTGEPAVYEVDLETGARVRTGNSSPPRTYDMVVGENGDLYTGGGCVTKYDWASTENWNCWTGAPWTNRGRGLAFFSNGDLAVLEEWDPYAPMGIEIVSADGSVRETLRVPELGIRGFDVPRDGAFEDGLIALGVEWHSPWNYFLVRWSRDAAGVLVRDPSLMPLDLTSLEDSHGNRFGTTYQVAVRPDGRRVLVPDPVRQQVREFDLDGNFLGVFATIPEDMTVRYVGPLISADAILNLAVSAADDVLVTTCRRLYRFSPDGAVVRQYEEPLGIGNAVAFTEPIPFASANVPCRPWSTGFWKRQCASLGQSRRALGTRSLRGRSLPVPPLHPAFRDGRLDQVVERADEWLAPFGVTACAALQPSTPNDWLDKALRRYATVALNVEARQLGRRCAVVLDGSDSTVGAVLERVPRLLVSSDPDDHREAFRLCGLLLKEEGE